MPNRGGYRGNAVTGNRFSSFLNNGNEHDNRGHKDNTKGIRRVRFKHNRKTDISEYAAHARLEEDDAMGFEFSKYGGGSRRKGSPVPSGKYNKPLVASDFGWYQVTIHGGHRYSRDDVIRAILNALTPIVFIPHYWRIEKNCTVFYVEDFTVAEKLRSYDKAIQMNDGFRLHLRVRDGFPYITVDDALKQKIMTVMSERYDKVAKCMNLACFHKDAAFKSVFCALVRPNVIAAVLNIMTEFTPEVEIINLSNNHLTNLEAFKNTSTRLRNLKALHLNHNKITSLAHLLVLRDIKLTEISLEGNPLRNRFKDQNLYISEVRRKFPHLMKLDGNNLIRNVSLDMYGANSLPKSNASCLIQESAAPLLQLFLSQYFAIFDSGNRQPLLDAYHEKSLMSITVAPASQAGRLASFWKYNRNLKRLVASDAATRNVKVGRLAIVSTLAEWPRVQHDKSSFSVDLTFISDTMLIFTVTGLFKELDVSPTATNGNIRSFGRTYFVARIGEQLSIRNELIYISNATAAQCKAFMKKSIETTNQQISTTTNMQAATTNLQNRLQPGMSADVMYLPNALSQINLSGASTSAAAALQLPNAINPVNINAASAAMQLPTVVQGNINENATNSVGNVIPDQDTKIRMLQAMQEKTKMNIAFCEKCLHENNWDFNTAYRMFENAFTEGRIPQEAFK